MIIRAIIIIITITTVLIQYLHCIFMQLQVPELLRAVRMPVHCFVGDHVEHHINAWIGPRGTVSPLHQDPDHNLLTQVLTHDTHRQPPAPCP